MLTKRYQNSAAQWQAFGVIRLSNHFPYKKLSPYDPVYAQLRKAAFISLFLSCPACPFKRLRIDGLVRPRSPWTNSCSRFTHGELVAMLKKKTWKRQSDMGDSFNWIVFSQCHRSVGESEELCQLWHCGMLLVGVFSMACLPLIVL